MMRWPFARKSTYDDILATYERENERLATERDEHRERLQGLQEDLERRRTPMFLTRGQGARGAETHPGLFPPDDRGTVLWDQHPGAEAVWIPVGPFTLRGHPYDEGFVLARRPQPDPRMEHEPVTLWEGFDLVPTDEADNLDSYGARPVLDPNLE